MIRDRALMANARQFVGADNRSLHYDSQTEGVLEVWLRVGCIPLYKLVSANS